MSEPVHEQSLIAALLRQVEQLRREHDAMRVTEVRVEVGPLTGVEPLLLASAFEQTADGACHDATLVIDEVQLLARCQQCEHSFEVTDYCFYCPQCSGNVRVTSGDEFQLISVTLQ